ncbi:hypothetical protein [Stenotrophomonas sp.]|uniref:hypothetical protein n=1 Tax=Stenotrophomonas sp. TaxID=69392 RepID=UPI00289A548A|nr:hypothetical protein [Stenotrophomonas sp.]
MPVGYGQLRLDVANKEKAVRIKGVLRKVYGLLLGVCLALPWSTSAGVMEEGTFAMMVGGACDVPDSPNCYLQNPVRAARVIDLLADAGVTRFLVPSAELHQLRLLGSIIQHRGLVFYTYERWSFEASLSGGRFDCAAYTSSRINSTLAPLREEFGATFAGLHFKDEPPSAQIAALGQLSECIRGNGRVGGLKVFINLLPLHANAGSYAGTVHAGALSPQEYGVDCQRGLISNYELSTSMIATYSEYARRISDEVKPDYLAFDLYPFVGSLESCPVAQHLLLSENMSIVGNLAKSRGQVPIAYLQNIQTVQQQTGDPFRFAGFRDLRWFAAWFYTFGGRGFANFASHDLRTLPTDAQPHTWGLLSSSDQPTHLLSEQKSGFGVLWQLYRALEGQAHLGFVDNALGVPQGQVAGWLSNSDFLVGEFGVGSSSASLLISTRSSRSSAAGLVGLNKWWPIVEKLDFETGRWNVVGRSTNAINVSLDSEPLALYRLSD